MTRNIDAQLKRRLPAKFAAGIAISAFLALGTFAIAANADEHRDDRHGGDYRDGRGRPGCCWTGGYYSAPPVVYAPAYYPPPVVYGPGIYLPGINIRIR
jgi:hypothetical protein